MFEIFREGDYNRAFHYIFYTDLEEHARDDQISKAANGETVFAGFLDDTKNEAARVVVESIVDELNEMDEEDTSLSPDAIRARLADFLVAAPSDAASS